MTALLMAWKGLGYWSLVGMLVIQSTVGATLVWMASGWRPGRPVRGSGVRPMLRFGGNLAGFQIVNFFARNADNALIGWYWGAGALGLYSRAYQLLTLPVSQFNVPVSAAALPTLSRLQSNPTEYRRVFSGSLGVLAVLGIPLVIFCMAHARDIILVVLGEDWLDTVPIFLALGPAALVGTANVAGSWVCVSLALTNRAFVWSLISVPIIVIGFTIGLPYGPVGVAISCSVSIPLSWILGFGFFARGTFLTYGDLLGPMWRPFTAAGFAGMITIPFYLNAVGHPAADLVVNGFVFVGCYLLVLRFLPGGRILITDAANVMKSLKVLGRVASPGAG
jgi:O-antigen/teichoic acid export membrane protein